MGLVVDNVSMITVCTILGLEGPVCRFGGRKPERLEICTGWSGLSHNGGHLPYY